MYCCSRLLCCFDRTLEGSGWETDIGGRLDIVMGGLAIPIPPPPPIVPDKKESVKINYNKNNSYFLLIFPLNTSSEDHSESKERDVD